MYTVILLISVNFNMPCQDVTYTALRRNWSDTSYTSGQYLRLNSEDYLSHLMGIEIGHLDITEKVIFMSSNKSDNLTREDIVNMIRSKTITSLDVDTPLSPIDLESEVDRTRAEHSFILIKTCGNTHIFDGEYEKTELCSDLINLSNQGTTFCIVMRY